MKYAKMDIVNGKLVEIESKTINQNELSCECWLIQINGLQECEKCDLKDTDECGGKQIRESLMNKKGFTVPLEGK